MTADAIRMRDKRAAESVKREDKITKRSAYNHINEEHDMQVTL